MNRRKSISAISSQTMAVVSVALVLFILGIVALLVIAAKGVSRDIREQVGFVVIVDDTATEQQILALNKHLGSAPYVLCSEYSSAEDVMDRWHELMDEETDVKALLGVNPFFPEFEVSVKAEYATNDSLGWIVEEVRGLEGVNEVTLHADIIDSINSTMNSLAVILCIVAAALLLISLVLINNTVRLAVYSRRFIIYTMKLVGATAGFIRRPFVIRNVIGGVISGILASCALAGLFGYLRTIEPSVADVLSWSDAACVFGGLLVAGIAICTLASLFAANKYLRLGYSDMFK